MSSKTPRHVALQDLTDQLCCEYAGAVPPGQIRTLVLRANHLVSTHPNLANDVRLNTVEAVARHLLTERLAVMGRDGTAQQPVA
jgi:hypothetical protein